ncbi:MAG: hypothetical protein CMJ40_03770 [Phycisphaerae bacterium]|nr:hypothetical protein [Phycisphaerae bacterium]|tara:strand:+ start:2656 stop:3297 length:642 start_codon:yes stop_codon:yes gene_type:complete
MERLPDSLKDRRISVILLAAVAVLVSGVQFSCKNRSRAMSAQLRDQVHELESENETLRLRQEELEIQLKTSKSGSDGSRSRDSAVPVVTRIMLDGASGRRTTPDASGSRPLEIHVTAVDGRNRPIQLAGSIRVKVTRIQEDGPPVELADIQLSPDELRDAWRGGLIGGPTWLVKVPLEESDLASGSDSLNVNVFYRDLRTGELLECGDEVDIR